MKQILLVFLICVSLIALTNGQTNQSKVTFASYISRSGWNAKIPRFVYRYRGPAMFVVFGICEEEPPCTDDDECTEAIQNIQDEHMVERNYDDIAWSFLVGGNNKVYAGRGFQVEGQHTPGRDNGVGICFIGGAPTQAMTDAAAELIELGLTNGNIHQDFERIFPPNLSIKL